MGKSDDDDEYVEYVDGYDDDDVVGDVSDDCDGNGDADEWLFRMMLTLIVTSVMTIIVVIMMTLTIMFMMWWWSYFPIETHFLLSEMIMTLTMKYDDDGYVYQQYCKMLQMKFPSGWLDKVYRRFT